jgi:type I restriction enzyme S subunit
MSKNTIKINLDKIADVVAGQSPKSIYYSSNEGVPFLQGNRTFGNLYPRVDTYTKKVTKLARKGDVLISVRAPVGDLNFAHCDLCIGRGLASMRAKNGDNNFVYYAIKFNLKKLLKKGTGTTFDSINKDTLEDLEIIIPETEIDRFKISKTLSSLDAKIELNNQINSELEKMAKTLYDYWFVQFDFPDCNGKPYKSSGGAMVWNAELKRAIPAGWEVKKMKELVIFEKGIEPGSAEYKNYKVNENYLKFYRVGNIDGDTATFIDASKKKYVFVREHNVLVTFDGSVGKVGFGINGLISSGIRKIHSNFLDDSFIYFLFNDNRIVNIIHQYAKGSIILHASQAIDHLNFVFNLNKNHSLHRIFRY